MLNVEKPVEKVFKKSNTLNVKELEENQEQRWETCGEC